MKRKIKFGGQNNKRDQMSEQNTGAKRRKDFNFYILHTLYQNWKDISFGHEIFAQWLIISSLNCAALDSIEAM
jgi:hypothetical protein